MATTDLPSPPAGTLLSPQKQLTIAFAGNPNVGKTALINALSGSRLQVGNWPGVTVEKKQATFTYQDYHLTLIDLPGTYSLSPHTIEERVCRDYLMASPPDLIVNVVDATNLERNLYLTHQLRELQLPMVMALSMWDDGLKKGYQIDCDTFRDHVQIPVIPTVAPSRQGIDALLRAILATVTEPPAPALPYLPPVEQAIQLANEHLPQDTLVPSPLRRWLSIRLLESDPDVLQRMSHYHAQDVAPWFIAQIEQIKNLSGEEPALLMAQHRQIWASQVVPLVLRKPAGPARDLTDSVDKFLLSRSFGIPAFLLILLTVFKLTFDISKPFVDWIDGFINGFVAQWITLGLETLHLPTFLISLLTEGVIGGAGLVLTFVPVLMFLYLFLAILEESGYMARAAFLMDRVMHRFGLNGKAFIPLLVGYGCNVPAVYATRTLENQTDRRLTVSILSFMSCGAKLPIYVLFTAVFFERSQAMIIMGMYLLGVMVAILWAIILRKTTYKEAMPAFIMELAPYRVPSFKSLWGSIWFKTRAFIRQAGTVIAATMIILWSLVNLPYGAPPEKTLLGISAQTIAPVFIPQGFGNRWEAVASIIPGFMAKEMVVGTLGVVLKAEAKSVPAKPGAFWSDLGKQITDLGLACVTAGKSLLGNILPATFVIAKQQPSPIFTAIHNTFTPLTALSYMVFNLLLLSCVSVIGAIIHEFNKPYLGYVLLLTTGTAYIISALVYGAGRVFGYQ